MSTDASSGEEPVSVEEMDRGDLEDEVRHLRERLDRLEETVDQNAKDVVNRQVFNHFIDRLVPAVDIDDYTADPMQHLATVEEFGSKLTQTVDAVEDAPQNPGRDAMTDNWLAVVEHAQTLSSDPENARQDGWVALYVQDVANATDCSRRWANDLVEDLADDHEGAKYQSPKENPKEGSEDRRKALLVNLAVWGEDQ